MITPPRRRPPRIRIGSPRPYVERSQTGPKRTVGDRVELSAEVIRDGHEELRADLRVKGPGDSSWSTVPMHRLDAEVMGVRWGGEVVVDRPGPWQWTVRAYVDRLASWRVEIERKVEGGQEDLSSELAEGAELLATRADAVKGRDAKADKRAIKAAAAIVGDESLGVDERVAAALDPDLVELCERNPDTGDAAKLEPQPLDVDVPLARFGAWYELFPRSWGGLAGVRRRLPALAQLGFDVLYLPPVSPIGLTKRKGRNNALVAGPDDPGSPWAIGGEAGGHDAVHPELGTVDDFVSLVADARALGMEVALDIALQCSADHPWLTEHPEWFQHRPDGTLKYAENPPKKYQDIYNLDFDCEDWRGLWTALAEVVMTWVDRGVRVFRVDNPHTKPLPFWEWLIATVRASDPDVVFLAEAFTYRTMMQELGRIGFGQSYTYFTWKQSSWELTEYLQELSGDEANLFRPNFFVNTPDILTEQLQHGGPATFVSRLLLAATLSPSYGVYSGYESFEHEAVRPGSEEYLDSEKYEARDRRLDGALLPLAATLNQVRNEHPALQHLGGIRFLDTENPALLAYAKQDPDRAETVICVVLLDPHVVHEGVCTVPGDLGLPPTFEVRDLLDGSTYSWQVGRNYVRLEPGDRPGHVLQVIA